MQTLKCENYTLGGGGQNQLPKYIDDVTAAMLVELEQTNVINFFCLWHQHGRQSFVFWISRDWLQVITE